MILSNRFLLIILFAGVVLVGCIFKKDEPRTFLLSQESKDYCLFLSGSWWVYQNEQTLEYDTLRITSIQQEVSYSKNSNENLERINIGFEQKRMFSKNIFTLDRGDSESILSFKYNGGINETIYFDSKVYKDDSVSVTRTCKYIQYFDSLQLKTIQYKDVKRFRSLILIEHKNIFWSKHIGIIKLEKPDGEIWNLINYSVQQ